MGFHLGEDQPNEFDSTNPRWRFRADAPVSKATVNLFSFLRDFQDTFLRTVVQVRLMRALPEFVASTSSMTGGIYGYFKEIILSTHFLIARLSMHYLDNVTRKK